MNSYRAPFLLFNKHIETINDLDEIVAKRCIALANERETIKNRAGFHWWPKIVSAQ